MSTLTLSNVWRRYTGESPTVALRDVSLIINQGEFVAIEGPSGGGKSTLLNVIGLLDVPSSGTYEIDGLDVNQASGDELARLRSDKFAFIFQSFHLLDRRPVIESVEMGLLYRAVPVAERRRLAEEALESVGLGHLAWQTASKLSGGQRQRVAIARAFATGAPVIVADEPTGNLDTYNSSLIVESLKELNRRGATIVLVTHSSEVAAEASRRVRIKDGRLVEVPSGSASPFVDSSTMPGVSSRLRARDLIHDAWSSLISRQGRTWSLVAAVSVGVTLAVATLGISESAGAQVKDTFNVHANRDVSITWQGNALNAQTEGQRRSIPDRLENLNGVTSAGVVVSYNGHRVQASTQRPAFDVNTFSVTPAVPKAGRMRVRWATGQEHKLSHQEVLVGSGLARQLEIGPLDAEPTLLLDGHTFTIAGVVAEAPRVPELLGGIAVSSQSPVLKTFDSVNESTALILADTGAAQVIAKRAPLVVNPYAPEGLIVDAPRDPTSLRAQVESDVQITLLALTGVALLASIAGLANAMVLSVMERRQEFGLRRAVGARPTHLLALVMGEATVIGALGGVVGLLGGLGTVLTVTLIRHWAPTFDLRLAPLAVLGGIVVGAVGGMIASTRATRIQPNEALRQ